MHRYEVRYSPKPSPKAVKDWNQGIHFFQTMRTVLAGRTRRQVPVLQQIDMTECGAACLAMILSYYGRQTQVSECRGICDVGRDGLTAQTIVKAAQCYGLRTKAYSIEPQELKYIQLPAVIHWNFNHFVVIEHWSPQRVVIVDPAIGRRRLTTKEFDTSFTGIVLTFEPGAQFQRRHKTARSFSWWHYFRSLLQTPETVSVCVQILAASLLLQILGLAFPLLTQILVDQILPFHMANVMTIIGFGMIVVVWSQMLLTYLRAALLIYLQARLDSQMMLNFLDHVLSLPFRFFQQHPSGDLLMRFGSNAIIRSTLSNQTLSILLDGIFILIYLIVLLSQSLTFGIFVFCIGAIQLLLLLVTKDKVQDLNQRDLLAQAESQNYLVEALSGIAVLKASGNEDQALDYWSNLFFKQLNISLQSNHLSAIIETVLVTLRSFAPLLLLWFGALRVLDGTLSLGTMLALNTIAIAFLTPLASLVSNGQQLQLVSAHFERLADIFMTEPEQTIDTAQDAPPLTGQIELRNVSFRHTTYSEWVLQNISVKIQPGQKVAIVGRSGSGKSTLARVLLGLFLPTSGEILYDDFPLQTLNYRTLRQQFGIVLQETFLFSGSIRQNISFSKPSIAVEAVMQAAKMAVIHDDIASMPMGYETLITEGGSTLSGGQRQRLAIARALANQPRVLLLDEATSHLDTVTEHQLNENLDTLACTQIVIAHRLSTIQNADLILVLDQGRLVEQGDHQTLLAKNAHYAALLRHQAH